jgi:phosphoribosyl-dephospho-CoA transferase
MIEVNDLLKIKNLKKITWAEEKTEWVQDALKKTPWVVVRRGAWTDGIPVGVRGKDRNQRLAGFIQPQNIETVYTPADLMKTVIEHNSKYDVFGEMLLAIHQSGIFPETIGPGGSFAFFVATGADVTNSGSDLDLIIKEKASRLDLNLMTKWQHFLCHMKKEVDAVVQTDKGLFSLQECVRNPVSFILKTEIGFELTGMEALKR